MHARTHARTLTLTHAGTHTHTHRTRARAHTNTHTHTHTHTHSHTHTDTHSHTHTLTHTHTHTQVARTQPLCPRWRSCMSSKHNRRPRALPNAITSRSLPRRVRLRRAHWERATSSYFSESRNSGWRFKLKTDGALTVGALAPGPDASESQPRANLSSKFKLLAGRQPQAARRATWRIMMISPSIFEQAS